jgi:antitoxin ParD1/3/4
MPTLNVDLTNELAEFVSREVSSGDYGSASELMMDALSALRRNRDSDMTEHLRQELALGLAQADRGEFSPRSVQEIAAAVIDEAKG